MTVSTTRVNHPIADEIRDNRARAQALLDKIKRDNAGKAFVRIPIQGGYKEVEVRKFNRWQE